MTLLILIGLGILVLLGYLVLLVGQLVMLQQDEVTRGKQAIYEQQDQTIRAMLAAARQVGGTITGHSVD